MFCTPKELEIDKDRSLAEITTWSLFTESNGVVFHVFVLLNFKQYLRRLSKSRTEKNIQPNVMQVLI